MPYCSHETFQKNTYSKKRVRARHEVRSFCLDRNCIRFTTDNKKLRRSPDSEQLDESPRRKKLRNDHFVAPSAAKFKVHCSPKTSPVLLSKLDRTPTLRAVEDTHAKPESAKFSSKKTEERCTVVHDSPRKSPSVLGPSRRTQSQNQKENRRIAPSLTDLASPYKGISSKTSTMSSSKNDKTSRFFRRPSVDTFSTHIPSKPASFHRRSSGSHALQNKHRNHDNNWIVPFLPLASLPLSAIKAKSSLNLDNLDITDRLLPFSPQICSTPVRKTRSLVNDSPDWTASPMFGSNKTKKSDILMKDDAAFLKDFADLVSYGALTVSQPNVVQSAAVGPKEAAYPNDAPLAMSFISSSPPPRNNESCDKQSSSESDPMNLRTMFSGLDLTEKCKNPPAPQEATEDAMPLHRPKRAKVVVEIPKKNVRFNVKLSSSKGKKDMHKNTKNKGRSQNYRSTPPPRVVTNDGLALANSDDEDDELLLTSKGWDWNPHAKDS